MEGDLPTNVGLKELAVQLAKQKQEESILKGTEDVEKQPSSLENDKQTAEKDVRDSFVKIRGWVARRETDLLGSIETSTQAKFDEHAIQSFISKIGNITVKINPLDNTNESIETRKGKRKLESEPEKQYKIDYEENNNNNSPLTITPVVRDYTQILPNGHQKCKRVIGPELGDSFGELVRPCYITIIPKHNFEIENNNIDNNNSNNNTNPASGSSSSSQQTITPQKRPTPFSSDDLLVISDSGNSRVILIEKTSGKVKSIIDGKNGGNASGLNFPIGTVFTRSAAHSNLILLVCDNKSHRVSSFDLQTGEYLDHFTNDEHLKKPSGIELDQRTNRIFVANTETNTITVHSNYPQNSNKNNRPFGTLLKVIGHSLSIIKLDSPRGIKVNSKGEIIVSSEHRITILNGKNYELIKLFGYQTANKEGFDSPFGVCVDQQDNILVCDCFNNRISIFDRKGKRINTFGKKGNNDSCFDKPVSVAVDNDIYLVDFENNRVMLF
eukprot:TRINITY_DN844_c0_g1_i2.p1 TRINITY_DN844_c0_g1~~TRINITY_DN844_c0_g1_i2.p1  ORF type:complete len:497 (-),score=128.30 TRINITY_DN844_c0_g1_i2:62-1552(-)